jgi:hypothetical protein
VRWASGAIDEGNVRSWVLDRNASITYASPLGREALAFSTYFKPLPTTRAGKPAEAWFSLEHHLPNKKLRALGAAAVFAQRLAEAEAKVIDEGTKKEAAKEERKARAEARRTRKLAKGKRS